MGLETPNPCSGKEAVEVGGQLDCGLSKLLPWVSPSEGSGGWIRLEYLQVSGQTEDVVIHTKTDSVIPLQGVGFDPGPALQACS
jgi:hypothetical protein